LATVLRRIIYRTRGRLLGESLPDSLQEQIDLDRRGLHAVDPGSAPVIAAALDWLCRAQDMSASADGGIARDFSLRDGWATSYPETTGYIVPTFLEQAQSTGSSDLRSRAGRMLEWLMSIQLPSGAIQGGKIASLPVAPVVFNTGQVLLGLAAGERAFGTCRASLQRAADWLVEVQDPDGCWRKHASPFAMHGDKTYDTHVAWGLLEAERLEPGRGYAEAAMANVRWALTHQKGNGWIDRCCLSDFARPLTHTLGYALRGMVEAYRFCRDPSLLAAARRTADGLLLALRNDGFLPGQLAADWSAAADWACLTGTVQVAHCWLMLFEDTGDARYRDGGFLANAYVRRTVVVDGPDNVRGAVRGSFPIDGAYCRYAYPNWAAKFMVDSLALERCIRGERSSPAAA
jgi:hypothetical protein